MPSRQDRRTAFGHKEPQALSAGTHFQSVIATNHGGDPYPGGRTATSPPSCPNSATGVLRGTDSAPREANLRAGHDHTTDHPPKRKTLARVDGGCFHGLGRAQHRWPRTGRHAGTSLPLSGPPGRDRVPPSALPARMLGQTLTSDDYLTGWTLVPYGQGARQRAASMPGRRAVSQRHSGGFPAQAAQGAELPQQPPADRGDRPEAAPGNLGSPGMRTCATGAEGLKNSPTSAAIEVDSAGG